MCDFNKYGKNGCISQLDSIGFPIDYCRSSGIDELFLGDCAIPFTSTIVYSHMIYLSDLKSHFLISCSSKDNLQVLQLNNFHLGFLCQSLWNPSQEIQTTILVFDWSDTFMVMSETAGLLTTMNQPKSSPQPL